MRSILLIAILAISFSCTKKEAMPSCMHDMSCTPEVYYGALKASCNGSSCCESSVKFIKEKGYQKSASCPPGSKLNMMKCPESVQWCEPEN